MICNLVSLLRCYLVTLKVGTIHVPIHDVRNTITVLSVALKAYQLWRRKALTHAFPGMSLKFKEHHPRNSDSHTHLEVVNKWEHSEPLRTCKLCNGISRFPWCSFHSSLCVPIYQSEQMCVRRYLKSSPNHSQSPHFPSVLHCLANFALVKLQCGSGSGSGSFILHFSLLSGSWPWESKFVHTCLSRYVNF